MNNRNTVAFLLLASIIFLIYSNVYECSWHFDDYNIITQNSQLHIDDLYPDSLIRTFYANPGLRGLYRPIPMLTFAVNWYLDHENMWGFHLVNNSIHFLTAFFLFLAIKSLLETPVGRERGPHNVYFIALLSTVLWAVNPIQTQAITYIVQRMAAMAAMFSVLSIYLYLKSRLTSSLYHKAILMFGCILCGAAGFFSKENTVMLPFSLLLIEIIFFKSLSTFTARLLKKRLSFIISILTLIIVIILVVSIPFYSKIKDIIILSYDQQPFTIAERLMTQARILCGYLSQLFYPTHHRLSIFHVVPVSTSIIAPWSTILSIAFVFSLILVSILRIKKNPFFSFAVLFFFLNHTIESSLLGLELIFEHRNYLPSIFLFLPISLGISILLQNMYKKNYAFFSLLCTFFILLVVFMGLITYTRNMDWRSDKTLWEDVLRKYPNATRAMHNLAHQYYEKRGNQAAALLLYQRILSKDWQDGSAVFRKGLTLNNMAAIYYYKGLDTLALSLWDQALVVHPPLYPAKLGKSRALIALGRWDDANRAIDQLLLDGQTPAALNFKAFILFKQGSFEDAIPHLQKSLRKDPQNVESMIYLAAIHSRLKLYEKARLFLKMANATKKDDSRILLMLLENSVFLNDQNGVASYTDMVANPDLRNEILYALRNSKKNEGIPLSLEKIIPLIVAETNNITKEWMDSVEDLIIDINT